MRSILLASTILLLGAALPAAAQETVGTDSIVKSLTPHDGGAGAGKTRGVKHFMATSPAEPLPADLPVVSLPVLFASGSAELRDDGRAQLDRLGAALKDPALNQMHFRIEGHTDTTGDDQTNLALSQRRAAAVVDYLASRYGVDRARLIAVGMGKGGLAVPTPDQTAEPRNRRVVVINLDG